MNILNNEANNNTVVYLLWPSGLKHTEKYTRDVDKLKSEAINIFENLNFKMKNELKKLFLTQQDCI